MRSELGKLRDERNRRKECRDAALATDLDEFKKGNGELKDGNEKLKSQLFDCQEEKERLRKELGKLRRENAKLKEAKKLELKETEMNKDILDDGCDFIKANEFYQGRNLKNHMKVKII